MREDTSCRVAQAAKNRMAFQKADAAGKLPYTGTVQTITTVARVEGVAALYRGFSMCASIARTRRGAWRDALTSERGPSVFVTQVLRSLRRAHSSVVPLVGGAAQNLSAVGLSFRKWLWGKLRMRTSLRELLVWRCARTAETWWMRPQQSLD